MNLIPQVVPVPTISFKESSELKQESIWLHLGDYSVRDAAISFLQSFDKDTTRKNYQAGFKKLMENRLIDPLESLRDFALKNHNHIVDQIKSIHNWAETTKQARAALYIAFTKYLERKTDGVIKKAIPNRDKGHKTFKKVREKVSTEALNEVQYKKFFNILEEIDPVASLIAKLLLHGCKRRNEVLSLHGEPE